MAIPKLPGWREGMAVFPESLGASACRHRCPLSNLLPLTEQNISKQA